MRIYAYLYVYVLCTTKYECLHMHRVFGILLVLYVWTRFNKPYICRMDVKFTCMRSATVNLMPIRCIQYMQNTHLLCINHSIVVAIRSRLNISEPTRHGLLHSNMLTILIHLLPSVFCNIQTVDDIVESRAVPTTNIKYLIQINRNEIKHIICESIDRTNYLW